MKRFPIVAITLFIYSLALVVSCNDDDDVVPAYVVELGEAYSDSSKHITSIRMDNGKTYAVDQTIAASSADKTYRCLCTYALDDDGGIDIYSLQQVFAQSPHPLASFIAFPMEPVKFYSCWKSDRYLNLKVGVMTSGVGVHTFGFSIDSVYTSGNKQVACFSLFHQRPDEDAESYTEETFLSMPTEDFADFDTLVISVPTYDGVKQIKRNNK